MCRALLSTLLLTMAALLGGGCYAFAGFGADYVRPTVLVTDGETGEPIAGARVHAPAHSGAWTDSGTTDKNGRVRIRVAEHVGSLWAQADGYMRSLDHGPGGGATVRIPMFRPPEPIAGLTIPRDFRGVLRAREGVEPQPPTTIPVNSPRGQREFYTPANVDGVTELRAPPKLTDGQPYHTRVCVAQLDDGTPLRYENPTAATGWGGEHVYVLPTIRDRVRPRPDGVALFQLGVRADVESAPPTACAIYFVGSRDQAVAAQQPLIAGATTRTATSRPTRGYLFKPTPIDTSGLPVSTELSPR